MSYIHTFTYVVKKTDNSCNFNYSIKEPKYVIMSIQIYFKIEQDPDLRLHYLYGLLIQYIFV